MWPSGEPNLPQKGPKGPPWGPMGPHGPWGPKGPMGPMGPMGLMGLGAKAYGPNSLVPSTRDMVSGARYLVQLYH